MRVVLVGLVCGDKQCDGCLQDGFVEKQKELVENGKWSDFLAGILGSTKALLAAPKAGCATPVNHARAGIARIQ